MSKSKSQERREEAMKNAPKSPESPKTGEKKPEVPTDGNQPSTKASKKVHTSPVVGVSDKGVTVFEDGKHPRTLRAKAQE